MCHAKYIYSISNIMTKLFILSYKILLFAIIIIINIKKILLIIIIIKIIITETPISDPQYIYLSFFK